jgi:FkbM family methyltransferase
MAVHSNLIYDVGMHRGEDTDFYLTKGFNVIAFEANPELITRCKSRFQDSLARGQLRIVEGAIAPSTAGKNVTFYCNSRVSVWGTIEQAWVARNEHVGAPSRQIDVPRVDIFETFQEFGIPYYLKIDIEGADHLVLQALRKLEDRPMYISIEANALNLQQIKLDINTLSEMGYRKFAAVQQATIPGYAIRTKDRRGELFEHVFPADSSGPFGEELAGPWRSREEVLDEYEHLDNLHRWFGGKSLIRRARGGGRLIDIFQRLYGKPLPGWHDTHASL